MPSSLCWNAVTAIATVVGTIIILVAAIIAVWQLWEARKATTAQAFFAIVSHLQAPECREARKTLLQIGVKDFGSWTDEQKKQAEIACTTYDAVGILLRKALLITA